MNKKLTLLTLFIFVPSIIAAFFSGFLMNSLLYPREVDLPILSEAKDLLTAHAYFPLPEDSALEYGMIRGMLQAYGDPYTTFFEPPAAELDANRLAGVYGGIGVRLERDSENNYILYPFQDGPAIMEGVMDGDRLIRVDDLAVTPEVPQDVVISAVRGPEGEDVEIEIFRPADESQYTFNITRQDIPIPSVTWHLADGEPRLGIVELNRMAATSPDEITAAVNDLIDQGASYFVLDLRGNGGGLLIEGIDIARLFLEDGVVIERLEQNSTSDYEVETVGDLADIPLIIWVDHNTASAAEIVAGALQGHERALLIGNPTLGKDTIQSVFSLSDGSSLHVTSAQWRIPGLDFPLEEFTYGLAPDITIPADSADPNPWLALTLQAFFGGN